MKQWAAKLTAFSLARPWQVIATSLLLGAVALGFTATHLSVRTDLDSLLSRDLAWRQTEDRLNAAFVSEGDDLTLVVTAPTPERAAAAADHLAAALEPKKDLFLLVERPLGGPFLEKEALLFASTQEVTKATQGLIRAQPFLGPLAADPTLHGLMQATQGALTDAETDPARLGELAPYLARFTTALDDASSGAELSWRALFTGAEDGPAARRALVTLIPKLDYAKLQPAAPARAAIREAVRQAGYSDPKGEVQVALTGAVAMQDDELSNLAEAFGPIALGAGLAMIAILYMALRSWKAIGAIVVTVLTGLCLTAAFGLAAFGEFTLVSVAFLPLFVGLGVDFAIQYAIRTAAEAGAAKDRKTALIAASASAGPGVALAAAATGLGFLAFWPTPYKGVSELGLIAGFGMALAALFALMLLPALMLVMGAGEAARESQLHSFARLGRFAKRHEKPVLLLTLAALVAGGLVLTRLKTDFDPVSLRSPKDVSVRLFRALAHDPDLTPNRLQALAPTQAQAEALALRLRRLPEVDAVNTVQSFIPPDQDAKLALIRDASLVLDPSLNPFDLSPPADEAATRAALQAAADRLAAVANSPAGADQAARQAALKASARLALLARATTPELERAQRVLTASLPAALDEVRASLNPDPVTLQSLPPDLRSQWLTAKGEALVDIAPKGDAGDPAALARFVSAVRKIAPDASGPPVTITAVGDTILGAFIEALVLSTLAIIALLFAILRRPVHVLLTVIPVALSFMATLATLAVAGEAINLENLIALPLLLGIGVSFNIYTVMAWRDGASTRLRASLSHAILFSALTTGASFAALAFSAHPGTASLGRLLLTALFWTLVSALVVQPALLSFASNDAEGS